jgi:hypothetical protein
LLICLVIFLIWYFSENHSIYSRLTHVTYNQSGIDINFEYPSVMKTDSQLLKALSKDNAVLLYNHSINSHQNLDIAASHQPIGKVLSVLKLSPSQLLNQVNIKSGDYITFINQKSASGYSDLYGDCAKYITNVNKQVGLICTTESKGITTAKIIGVDTNNQYTLYLVMPDNIWKSDQQVWQKIEKSFTY